MRLWAMLALGALVLGGGFFHVLGEQAERERLQRRIDTLSARLDALEADAPGTPAAQAPWARAADSRVPAVKAPLPSGARAPVQAAVAAGPAQAPERVAVAAPSDVLSVLESEDPEVKASMRRLVQEQQLALREEARERRQAAWEERTSRRLEELARQASLSSQQVDGLFAILTAHRDRVGETFRAARESGEFEQAEAQVAQLDRQTDEEARALLDARQYEAYQAMRVEERERRRGPGRNREPGRPALRSGQGASEPAAPR